MYDDATLCMMIEQRHSMPSCASSPVHARTIHYYTCAACCVHVYTCACQMCISIQMCICMHTHAHLYSIAPHVYMFCVLSETHVHACAPHVYIYTCVYLYMCIDIHLYIPLSIYIPVTRKCMHACTHAWKHARSQNRSISLAGAWPEMHAPRKHFTYVLSSQWHNSREWPIEIDFSVEKYL